MSEQLEFNFSAWDVESYLGLPYRTLGETRDGVCCLGLVILFFAEHGITLESPRVRTVREARGSSFFDAWTPIIEPSKYGDLVLMKNPPGVGLEDHLGIWFPPKGVLHASLKARAVVTNEMHELKNSIVGFARHKCLT
jgi:cell wall-associated NlpC family hydrolase